jgi:hypothetical protein
MRMYIILDKIVSNLEPKTVYLSLNNRQNGPGRGEYGARTMF